MAMALASLLAECEQFRAGFGCRVEQRESENPNLLCASEIGPMSGSHNKDDLVKDMLTMVDDMLADMCGLIVKTIALIPPERDDERLSACAFVLEVINEAVERIVNAERTEH